MVDKMVGPIKPVTPRPAEKPTKPGSGVSFDEILKEKSEGIKFSGHAVKRIYSRDISPNRGEVSRLEAAVEKARAKGARECLVLMDDVAYLVSVKNQTVVTVIDKDELKERIFTSIDSVVMA